MNKLKKCRNVGQLIKQLEMLPKTSKLTEVMRPVQYNTSEHAKSLGLKKCVGFESYDL